MNTKVTRDNLREIFRNALIQQFPDMYDFQVYLEEEDWETDWGERGSYEKITIEYRTGPRKKWKQLHF